MIIDSHVHVSRDYLSNPIFDQIKGLKESANFYAKPLLRSLHFAQPLIRIFPEPLRRRIDPITTMAGSVGLILESTPEDLIRAMRENDVSKAVVIAHPPLSPNDWIMNVCEKYDSLIPAVNIPSGTARPGEVLRKLHKKGAGILKIHGAADGEGVDSPRYKALIRAASDLDMPIILHTGCIHSSIIYKNPEMGRAQQFTSWFENYPKTQFILAHMNFHDPYVALDLAETFENVWLETSWQPSEMIGEAVRRIGSDRILYGSDWPILGDNFHVGIKRVRDAVDSGWLTHEDQDKILGKNALKIFKINETITETLSKNSS